MTLYAKTTQLFSKYIGKARTLKWGFNLTPMYRRSTARITFVSKDLMEFRIRLPLSWKNRNYVGSIFGGSMFSSVDPIPMVQLINLLDSNYVVWDKSAEILFKRPARENLYAVFRYTPEELASIKKEVSEKKEMEFIKTILLTNKEGTVTFCEVHKKIYVADRKFYKEKLKSKGRKS